MKLVLTKDPSHKGYYQDQDGNLYVFRFGGRPIKVDGYRDDKPKENVQVEEVSVEKDTVIDHTKNASTEENNKFINELERDKKWQEKLSKQKEFMTDEDRKKVEKDIKGLEEEINNTKERNDSSSDSKQPILKYSKEFTMESPVNDFDAAQEYLSNDDMTQYLPENLKDAISKAEWVLDDESSGHINIETSRELEVEEMKELEDWIDGQNSDGLGEGFEQQDFAESYYDPYTGDGPYTYSEAEEEISRRIDNMDYSDYESYLSEEAIEEGIDNYIKWNNLEPTDDPDIRDGYRAELADDPFSYIDDNAIYDARDKAAMESDDSDINTWYNMSSMRSNKRGFEIEEVEKELDFVTKDVPDKTWTPELGRQMANEELSRIREHDPEYNDDKIVYDKGDYSALATKEETEYYNQRNKEPELIDGKDAVKEFERSRQLGKEWEEDLDATLNRNLNLMVRYSGTIQTLQAEHPNWPMTKIMEKIRKLDEED